MHWEKQISKIINKLINQRKIYIFLCGIVFIHIFVWQMHSCLSVRTDPFFPSACHWKYDCGSVRRWASKPEEVCEWVGKWVGVWVCMWALVTLTTRCYRHHFTLKHSRRCHFFPLKVHTSKESPLGWGFLVIKHIIGFIPAYSSSSLFRNFLIFYNAAARICGAKH